MIDQVTKIIEFIRAYKIEIKDPTYYLTATTHNSYAYENKLNYNYQRLEFLGDAVLNCLVADYLFRRFPTQQEGYYTECRQKLVRDVTLAKVTNIIKLSDLILVGRGEAISNENKIRDNICADVYEACLGAIYMDLGLRVTRRFLNATLLKQAKINGWLKDQLDYKGKLQELLRSNKKTIEYVMTEKKHVNNVWHYEFNVLVDSMIFGSGIGSTIKEAKQNAAKSAMDKLAVNKK